MATADAVAFKQQLVRLFTKVCAYEAFVYDLLFTKAYALYDTTVSTQTRVASKASYKKGASICSPSSTVVWYTQVNYIKTEFVIFTAKPVCVPPRYA